MSSRIIAVDPFDLVVFGGAGDLAYRKLLPALYHRHRDGQIPKEARIIGVSRRGMSDGEYREATAKALREHVAASDLEDAVLKGFLDRLHFVPVDAKSEAGWNDLAAILEDGKDRVRAFYLAVDPGLFGTISARLGEELLVTPKTRVIIEKPIGHDLESARAVNDAVGQVFDESQIYRIDHYLGKETVQTLMALRFANALCEPIWNAAHIDHVQITVAETLGVEGRAGYYDTSGALRDMVQNHLFMLLALTAMEPPISFEADAVRDERLKVLQAIAPFTQASVERVVVRGQYGAGRVKDEDVRGYLQEDKVAADSKTETFVALRLQVENWRWAGVPFYLRTGKRMTRRVSEIAVQFRQPPFMMFRNTCVPCLNSNVLVIRVQPEEGITLHVDAKVPGQTLDLQTVAMDFKYDEEFAQPPSTGYETLLYDALTGDQTLFHRADSTEVSWRAVMPILDAWQSGNHTVSYDAGSWGPEEAHELLERDGRAWRRP